MKTTFLRLLLLAPLLLAGCVDDKPVIQVNGVCAPPSDASACRFSGTCSAFYLGEAVVDTTSARRLWIFLEVANRLEDNSNPGSGRVNTHDAFISEITTDFEGLALPTAVFREQYRVPTEGTSVVSAYPLTEATMSALRLLPTNPGTCSLDSAACTADGDCCTMNCDRPGGAAVGTCQPNHLLGKIKLKGTLGDGGKFETASYDLPVRVCAGCVPELTCPDYVTCPPDPLTLEPAWGQLPRSMACGDTETFSINVSVTGAGTGSIQGLGATCAKTTASATNCTGEAADQTTVTLTAVPSGASTFTTWGGACAASGASPTCDVTINAADVSVTARFD